MHALKWVVMSAKALVLTMLQNSLTDKIGDAIHLFQNCMHCCGSIKAIALYCRFFATGTGTASASLFCSFFHNSPKLIAQKLNVESSELNARKFACKITKKPYFIHQY